MTVHELGPTLWVFGSIATVVTTVVKTQGYLRSHIKPTEDKVGDLSNDVTEMKTKVQLENIRSQEHWSEVKELLAELRTTVDAVRLNQAEVKVALFGHDGSNGIRGELRLLRDELKDLRDK